MQMQLFGSRTHLIDWVEKAKAGDSRAQKAIYDALSGKMYAVCLRYCPDKEAAADLLQDGFVTLFTKLDSYSGDGSFEGWARKIFVNTALMSLRKNDAMKDTQDIEEAFSLSDPDPSALSKINYKELIRLIGELPAGFRTVFNLYVVEGYSHKEIGDMLGISEVTSRSQLARAKAILQDKIRNL